MGECPVSGNTQASCLPRRNTGWPPAMNCPSTTSSRGMSATEAFASKASTGPNPIRPITPFQFVCVSSEYRCELRITCSGTPPPLSTQRVKVCTPGCSFPSLYNCGVDTSLQESTSAPSRYSFVALVRSRYSAISLSRQTYGATTFFRYHALPTYEFRLVRRPVSTGTPYFGSAAAYPFPARSVVPGSSIVSLRSESTVTVPSGSRRNAQGPETSISGVQAVATARQSSPNQCFMRISLSQNYGISLIIRIFVTDNNHLCP